jgi:hypothetical protein
VYVTKITITIILVADKYIYSIEIGDDDPDHDSHGNVSDHHEQSPYVLVLSSHLLTIY